MSEVTGPSAAQDPGSGTARGLDGTGEPVYTAPADAAIDRRRLKRSVAVWRIVAVIAVVAAIAVAVDKVAPLSVGRHVAVLTVEGIILSDRYLEKAISDLAKNDSAVAVIVRIDSPGGSTFASETLYQRIRTVAETKPVVAVMENVAASGGYMTAIAADHILAGDSTITGSIGVILEATNVVGLLEKLGIENEPIKSAPLKAQPNPFERMTPAARQATQNLVDEVYEMFVDMVAERRGLSEAQTKAVSDGRVFTGRTALQNGLIDGIGHVSAAREWLSTTHNVDQDLPERDVEVDYPDRFVDQLTARIFGKSYLPERLTLDGLISLWHAS